jgi:hypothetical protein
MRMLREASRRAVVTLTPLGSRHPSTAQRYVHRY